MVSDLNSHAITYQQLLQQMHQLGALSVCEHLFAKQEKRDPLASEIVDLGVEKALLLGMVAGMLSGTANLSHDAMTKMVHGDTDAAKLINPASNAMTGAIGGLIYLNQNV
jgi:hypothetical protein